MLVPSVALEDPDKPSFAIHNVGGAFVVFKLSMINGPISWLPCLYILGTV